MDILLVFPPITIKERYGGTSSGSEGHLPPLGIAYIAGYLESKGLKVGLIDAPALNYTIDDILEQVEKQKPAMIGISSITSTFHRAVLLAKKIKEKHPEIPIVLGGQHATIMKEKIHKENDCFDIVVYGEGETTTYEIVKINKEGNLKSEYLKKVKGILFNDKNKIIITEPRPPIEDLDSLPYPARHLLPIKKYVPLPNQYKRKPVVHMIMIRGCPFSCSFCSASAVFGKKIRYPSPERAVEEIKHVIGKYGAKEISFWDDMITVNKEWLDRFCSLIIQNKLDIVWSCYARVDSVNLEMLKKMRQAGCWNIFYGIEAGDQQLLNNINKGITLEQSKNAVAWAKEACIEVRGSFMLCLPGETPELAKKTIAFAEELNPDYAQFSLTTPYPGTKLYEEAEKYGRLTTDFKEYHGWSAVFIPYGYKSKEEALKIYKEAFRSFYMRPKYVLGRIIKINSISDIKRYLNGFKFLFGFFK